jgi:ACR3 family arsenite efflux pump ArsB
MMFKESLLKHAAHGALGLALLGLAGCFSGVLKFPALLMGEEVARPAAVMVQTAMAVLCVVYLVLGVMSFIKIRRERARKAAA